MKHLELKIIPPLVTLICGVLMWGVSKITPQITLLLPFKNILAILFLALGLLLMGAAAFSFFKAKTTINPMRPDKSSSLVTGGLYRFSRNPIYLADLLFLVAWGFFLANLFSFILIIGFILYMNRFQIILEERALEELFSEQYLAYKNRVRRWI